MVRTWHVVAVLSAFVAAPAAATSSYTYGEQEYVTIAEGESPDGRYAIAAHGVGEDASLAFSLYLTTNHGRKVIGPLEEIDDTFETAANAYTASWSPDSRFVALNYRVDRHATVVRIYRIENGRAKFIRLPLLADEWRKDIPELQEIPIPSLTASLEWLDASHIRIREEGFLKIESDNRAIFDKLAELGLAEPGKSETGDVVEFTLEAEAELTPRNELRITQPAHLVHDP